MHNAHKAGNQLFLSVKKIFTFGRTKTLINTQCDFAGIFSTIVHEDCCTGILLCYNLFQINPPLKLPKANFVCLHFQSELAYVLFKGHACKWTSKAFLYVFSSMYGLWNEADLLLCSKLHTHAVRAAHHSCPFVTSTCSQARSLQSACV